jgi:hypothetical protein
VPPEYGATRSLRLCSGPRRLLAYNPLNFDHTLSRAGPDSRLAETGVFPAGGHAVVVPFGPMAGITSHPAYS